MTMLRILLSKDLARMRRNPWPLLINLAIPLVITAIMGMVFGPSSRSGGGGLGKIRLAIVDLDETPVSQFIRGAFAQDEAAEHFETVDFETREDALAAIQNDGLSAAFIIPDGFMEAYLYSRVAPPLEVVKNPSQSFYPAIIEEVAGLFSTFLNATAYNLADDFPEWIEVFEGDDGVDLLKIAAILTKLQARFDKAEDYLFPPLVTYGKEERLVETEDEGPVNNVFAYMLPALSTMFLMFLADGAIRDLYRELSNRTLTRFRTFSQSVQAFVFSKIVYGAVLLAISSAILFGGGSLIFSIAWASPLKIAAICLCFSLCIAGFLSLLAALARSEKRADAFNSMIIMAISFAGGSFFPTNVMPAFITNNISPLMPNFWFIESVRAVQFGSDGMAWTTACALMVGLGIVLGAVAARLLRNTLLKGKVETA